MKKNFNNSMRKNAASCVNALFVCSLIIIIAIICQ